MSGVSGVTCSTVTSAQLAAITGTLSLNDSTADDDNDDITTLQAGDFEGLSGVVILNLIDNRLTTLPANVFSGLTGATLVQLDRNTISTLDADAFNGLDVLTGLSLNGNSLSTLPSGIFSDISDTLESLNLSGNSFSTLVVDRISGLTRLKALDLKRQQLKSAARRTLPRSYEFDISESARQSQLREYLYSDRRSKEDQRYYGRD